MAQNRTFQFYGIGCGNTPVTVTARVNSTEIFSGEIATIDQPIDPYPYPIPAQVDTTVLFTLEDSALLNTDFAGSLPSTVTVTGGYGAMVGWINCNYYQGNTATDPAAGTVDNFGQSYFDTPTNSEGTPDPRSSVYIDGVQQVPPLAPSTGRWIWLVPTGSTMTYNWNIGVGQVGNIPGNYATYTAPV
jgi:hypothetical protein